MTAQEYIASGAIEAVVLGLASPQEVQWHYQMEQDYPQVKEERIRIEAQMEASPLAAAPAPPAQLQANLRQLLMSQGLLQQEPEAKEQPQAQVAPTPVEPTPAKVIPITQAAPKPVRWLRGALAACVLLLMGSVLLNFYYYGLYAGKRREFNSLVMQQNTLLAQQARLKDDLNFVLSPQVKQVAMPAVTQGSNAFCMVYYNQQTKEVFVNANNLPTPAANKQYQLWAIVDGKPVDAGLLQPDNANLLQRMKTMPQAQAFAITLENKGGSPTPTLEAMMVMGKV